MYVFYTESVIDSTICRYTADIDSVVFLDNHEPPFTEVVEQFKDVIQHAFKVDEEHVKVRGEKLVPRKVKSVPLSDVTADDEFVEDQIDDWYGICMLKVSVHSVFHNTIQLLIKQFI